MLGVFVVVFFFLFQIDVSLHVIICQEKLSCQNQFSIYIDALGNNTGKTSPIFARILQTIQISKFFTNNSENACLYLAPVDTLDRDRRSKQRYFTYFIEQKLHRYTHWTDPTKTHLIFNHYTGRVDELN